MIDKAGIYRDIPEADYFADPCPEPSFSQSIGKIILDRSPAHARLAHPRLAPKSADEDEAEKYDKAKAIGNAAHLMMIGRGKRLAVGDFDAWRSDKAKTFRAESEAAGQTPILAKHMATAERVVIAGRQQLAMHEEHDCFADGSGEVMLAWQENGLWFRCLVDWLHDDLRTVEDFKTSGMSVAEHVIGRVAADAGWQIQAAMIERGLDVLDPKNAGRRKFRFIAQEQAAPYCLNVVQMTEYWMTIGRKQLQFAIDRWTLCMKSNQWPGYSPHTVTPEFPQWMESRWLQREIDHDDRQRAAPDNLIMAG